MGDTDAKLDIFKSFSEFNYLILEISKVRLDPSRFIMDFYFFSFDTLRGSI